jgi:glycosyltransferase involved in cell wall biosynthesis
MELANQSDSLKTLLSIVTVTLNADAVLENTILSVISLGYPNVELIIIDGGSSDNTVGIIEKYDALVDYWVSEPDSGIYSAMNKGIARANGLYVCFINAGDQILWIPPLDSVPPADILAFSVQFFEGGCKSPNIKLMQLQNTMHHQGLIYRTSLFDEIGYFNPEFKILGDYDFNLRALKHKCTIFTTNRIMSAVDLKGLSAQGRFLGYKEEMLARFGKVPMVFAILLIPYSMARFLIKKIRLVCVSR